MIETFYEGREITNVIVCSIFSVQSSKVKDQTKIMVFQYLETNSLKPACVNFNNCSGEPHLAESRHERLSVKYDVF